MASTVLLVSVLLFASGVLVYGQDTRVKRLISGMESDHAESPYMVSMQAEIPNRWWFGIPIGHSTAFCGGTIISDRWVLTAAHCFGESTTPSHWHARIASPNIERSVDEGILHFLGLLTDSVELQQMELHAERIIIHPDYDGVDKFENDIALVKLKETIPLKETDRVAIVEIAQPSDDIIADTCTAYGWGCLTYGSGVSTTIQKATLPLLSDRECARFWRIPRDIQICAGGRTGNMQSACHGDSGGPLVCQTREGIEKQVGVISYISNIDPTYYPVVLTRLSAYTEWITKYTSSTQ